MTRFNKTALLFTALLLFASISIFAIPVKAYASDAFEQYISETTAPIQTIFFNGNGGSGIMWHLPRKVGENVTLTSNAFTKTGCTFVGWATSPTAAASYTDGQTITMPEDGLTLYAVWTENRYILTLNRNDGLSASPSISMTITYGGTYGMLPTHSRGGYVFNGWFTAATGGTRVTSNTKVTITANQTLYAHWIKEDPITYYVNGGTGNMPIQTAVAGSSVTLSSNAFTRTGYTFAGWSTSPRGTASYTNGQTITMPARGLTLFAVWRANIYTMRLNWKDGSNPAIISTEVIYGEPYGWLPKPTRSGYTFKGWFTSATGGTQVTSSTKVSIAAQHTLYAHWTGQTITYKANGGTGTMPIQMAGTGERIKILSNTFTRPGYKFICWDSPTDPVPWHSFYSGDEITMPEGGLTLYAEWSMIYTVIYDSNGGSGTMDKHTGESYCGKVWLRSNKFTRLGYTFAGWAKSKTGKAVYRNDQQIGITPGEQLTLYAVWEGKSQVITYHGNGGRGAMANQIAVTGARTTLRGNAFEKTGYTFAGWATSNTATASYTNCQTISMPVGGLRLYAVWKPQ